MADLQNNTIHFDQAGLSIRFNRTLRLHDTGTKHMLPAGLGPFQLRNVEQLPGANPALKDKGGVAMPMYNNEAMWMSFASQDRRPVLLKAYAGGVNAITGELVTKPDLKIDPTKQDYFVIGSNAGSPAQPWSDGFRGKDNSVRQYVATANDAATVEGQLRGKQQMGGMQFIAIPMNEDYYKNVYLKEFPATQSLPRATRGLGNIGIGAGAQIEQKIYEDKITQGKDPNVVWDATKAEIVQLHTVRATEWPKLAGEKMPYPPITEKEYQEHGIPYFKLNDKDAAAVPGTSKLDTVKPIDQVPGKANPAIELDIKDNFKAKPPKNTLKPW